MIQFPTVTTIHRRLPKEAFYKHLPLTQVLKDKFISDVERIVVENSLTMDNLNLSTASTIKEILLLSIQLKKQEFDNKVIEAIARQNRHKLVFLLSFENSCQLAIYHGKLYRTPWLSQDEISLELKGYTLNEIWDAFIQQIALFDEKAEITTPLSTEERLLIQEKILKLEKLIQKTEKQMWKEIQPKKKFELHAKLNRYKEQLEELKYGKA